MDERLRESIEEHYDTLKALAEWGQTDLSDDAAWLLKEYDDETN